MQNLFVAEQGRWRQGTFACDFGPLAIGTNQAMILLET
jgi:hypothetical protein